MKSRLVNFRRRRRRRRDVACYVSTMYMYMCIYIYIFTICTLLWGCEDERQPQKAPVIANLTVTDITESSAKCTFRIEPVGATQQAGVIFGTEASLLSATTEVSTTTLANGNISLTLSSLHIDTEYYYKAYISDKHNSFIYSEVNQFRTKSLIIDVSAVSIAASYTAGSYKFTITSNGAWAIASNQEWCTVQPTSGNGDREITVSVTENTTGTLRTATLTITAGNQSQQVTVEQDIDNTTLDVSVSTINAPYTAGQHTFTVTSNAEWTIASDEEWCTVQPTSGNGDQEITVSVTENVTGTPRTATLTITAGNHSQQVTVEQDIDNTALEVSESIINVPHTVGQHSFIITSNAEWTIASDQEWCIVQPTSGNGNREITVSVTENETGTPRTATLTITAGNLSKQVIVEQDIDNTMLDVSVSEINAPTMAGQYSFTVTSNAVWTIASNQNWCTVQPASGNGNREITVSVTANATGPPRTATLTITASSSQRTATIAVTQSGVLSDFMETINGQNISMIAVLGGTFTMGCTLEQGNDCSTNETPVHQVTLSDFCIGKYEVTQGQWKAIMGNNPSYFDRGDNYPVEQVSWRDIVGSSGATMTINNITYYANGFIYRLNQLTGKQYRLPTEAEWEYAARGGKNSNGNKYSGSNTINDVAWYNGNANSTHTVGEKLPNELGIHDMSGNVREWCSDRYGSYSSDAQSNPTGPTGSSQQDFFVNRGGSWGSYAISVRVSSRYDDGYLFSNNSLGFRLACSSN